MTDTISLVFGGAIGIVLSICALIGFYTIIDKIKIRKFKKEREDWFDEYMRDVKAKRRKYFTENMPDLVELMEKEGLI